MSRPFGGEENSVRSVRKRDAIAVTVLQRTDAAPGVHDLQGPAQTADRAIERRQTPVSYDSCSSSTAARTEAFIAALQEDATTVSMTDQVLIDDWLRLVRAEYEELPDLHLTHAEVERLWGLDPPTADAILTTLVSSGVLRKTARGGYIKSNTG